MCLQKLVPSIVKSPFKLAVIRIVLVSLASDIAGRTKRPLLIIMCSILIACTGSVMKVLILGIQHLVVIWMLSTSSDAMQVAENCLNQPRCSCK